MMEDRHHSTPLMLAFNYNKNKGIIGALLKIIPNSRDLWNCRDRDGRNILASAFHQRYDLVNLLEEIPKYLSDQEWFWTATTNPQVFQFTSFLFFSFLFFF